jgi:hypothetical protein
LSGAAGLADARLDLALAQGLFERARGVATVGPELLRLDAAREQPVQQRQQVALLVLVAGRQAQGQRGALGVDG